MTALSAVITSVLQGRHSLPTIPFNFTSRAFPPHYLLTLGHSWEKKGPSQLLGLTSPLFAFSSSPDNKFEFCLSSPTKS